jgi:lauroyl/myristoyl acyltransferase
MSVQKKYRREINCNYQLLIGRQRPAFWIMNALTLGKNCALMLEIGNPNDEKILDRVEIKGENNLMAAYKKGRGVVVVSLHFGPWEFLPQLFARKGYPVAIAAQPQRNGWLGLQLLKIRQSRPITVTDRIAEMKHALKTGALLGFLLDNSSKTRKLETGWLWPGFRVLRTPFALSAIMKSPIVPMVVHNRGLTPVVEIGTDFDFFKNMLTHYPEEWVFFDKQ